MSYWFWTPEKLTREQVKRRAKEAREKGKRLDLDRMDLSQVDLSRVDLSEANLSQANLQGANLSEVGLLGAYLNRTILSGADLSQADLAQANLFRADLTRANLRRAYLSEAYLREAYLRNADLSQANLSEANLSQANLSRTNLAGANFTEANLTGANLTRVNLTGANLTRVNLTQTKLDSTNFSKAIINRTYFIEVDLGQANSLANADHKVPSIIDLNTIYHSKDKIPEVFLKQAGVHPDIIRWQHSLHTLPTVFICYSHKDEKEKELFLTHLSVLKELGKIDIWDDTRITGGADWEQEIIEAIACSTVAILLVSANFLTSKIINTVEIPQFLERYSKDEDFVIYPIIVKPCLWNAVPWLKRIEVRPKGGKPIWGGDKNVEEELSKIASEVEGIIKDRWLC